MTGRFLPGVPEREIEAILNNAPGNEIATGKFDNPESSAALAVNAFGFFFHRAGNLPALPGCEGEIWPARSLSIEAEVRFPERSIRGYPPHLDCLVETPSALIGIESKRFEPYRSSQKSKPSKDYCHSIWGQCMGGYESIRDSLRNNPAKCFAHLDAAQLFKHAFALRTEVHRRPQCNLKPILFYVYAEPAVWPSKGTAVDGQAKARHRDEIERFGKIVSNDEVKFVSCSWRCLLDAWTNQPCSRIRAHAQAVAARFSP